MDLIFKAQNLHREHWPSGDIELATLLSVKTGGCPENCGYCPQANEFDTGVKAQKLMSIEAVTSAAKAAKDAGATRFCMGAAWRSPKDSDIEKMSEMISSVKSLGLQTCATLGMLQSHQAQALKEAGLDFYNHNLDTAPDYYQEVVSTRTYQERLDIDHEANQPIDFVRHLVIVALDPSAFAFAPIGKSVAAQLFGLAQNRAVLGDGEFSA